jgi:serine/threonine protein kinase
MPMTTPIPPQAPPTPFQDSLLGRTVMGKWRIEKRLGAGGMGTVYLAHDVTVDRPVALKFLLPSLVAQTEYRARFEQEARTMAKVDHPNLATLYSVERDGEVPFLVMKYVTGKTLAQRLKERPRVPLLEAAALIRQMGDALMALHGKGFVHRDLKPGNVIVSDAGHVTLLDFGLVRSTDAGLTRPGVALGSPFYMSPEQAIAGTLDARSDLYTFGVLITEVLTGKRPFPETEAHASLLAHLEKAPTPAHVLDPTVPESVSLVVLEALRKKPHERPSSVAAFTERLLQAISGAVAASTAQHQALKPPKAKSDSGKQGSVGEPISQTNADSPLARKARAAEFDDEETVSARSRARRASEQRGTDIARPVLDDEEVSTNPRDVPVTVPAGARVSPVAAARATVLAPSLQAPPEAARTHVGLQVVGSEQTLSAVSEVTPPAMADSASTLAAIEPVAGPNQSADFTRSVLDPVASGDAINWMNVGLFSAGLLVVLLGLWVVFG